MPPPRSAARWAEGASADPVLSPARAHCRQLTAQLEERVLSGQNGNTVCLRVF